MAIRFSRYKNKKSIIIENDSMRAEFIPEPGGKMVSLIKKETGYEYLVQRPGKVYRDQPADGDYLKGECSGYDDMFPTIDACDYQEDPWKRFPMGDHGEVWNRPWNYKIDGDNLVLSVEGFRFPYRLEKNVSFRSGKSLQLQYTLENLSEYKFEFLWAAHIMLNIEPGTKIYVPGDCKKVISALSNINRPYGEIMDWPIFKDKEGRGYRADISRSPKSRGWEKFFFQNKLKEGWCKLIYPNIEDQLIVSFSSETVPYLCILMNENGWGNDDWNNLYNIFIEPCTVCYDRPDVAKRNGQTSAVNGGKKYQWNIELTI